MLIAETRRGRSDHRASVYSERNILFLPPDPLLAPAVQLHSLFPGILLYLL